MPKPITILILIIISLLSLSQTAYAVTEFNCIIDPDSGAGFDYASVSAWEDALAPGTTDLDLTSAATQVFSWDAHGASGVPADGASVWKFTDNGVTATCVHTTGTDSGQILLKDIANGTFADNDIVQYQINTDYSVTLSSAGDSAIALATCRTTGGTADTTAVTIDGWVTSTTNYIKVWTDPSESYRHSGVWNEGKYRLEVSTTAVNMLETLESNVKLDGLQLKRTSTSGYNAHGISGGALTNIEVSNNILWYAGSGNSSYKGIGLGTVSGGSNIKVWNNIVYDWDYGIALRGNNGEVYAYNNTVYNCVIGIFTGYQDAIAKNNISYNNTDNYYSTFDATSDYNLSGPSQTDAPDNGHSVQAGTLTFENIGAGTEDFHLVSTDTNAIDAGTSNPGSGLFTDDIDGDTRGGSWDIGADETVNNIYRSVGPSASTALATGAGNDLTIDGTTLVFASALADTIGVGDVLQYDVNDSGADIDANDALAFIHSRTSPTRYTARSADGSSPTTIAAYDQDWSIFRAYTSLANAENGIENTGIDEDLRNFDDWTAGGNAAASDLGKDISATGSNELWNIACYANGTTSDTAAVTITGWTTGASNYIKVYTPTETTEVGTSQRHTGNWDEGAYRLETSNIFCIEIYEEYVRLDGLQLKLTTNIERYAIRYRTISGGEEHVSNCIIQGVVTGGSFCSGIVPVTDITNNPTLKIWNNIIYGFDGSTGCGILVNAGATLYIYNNTISDCTQGIRNHADTGTFHTKNNAVFNTTDDFNGTIATCDYNASDDGDGTNAVDWTQEATDWANVFEDYSASPPDFHLKNYTVAGIALIDQGTDLTSEGGFTDDIDGDTRPWIGSSNAWDIGADEYSFSGLILEGVVLEGVVVE